MSSQGYGQSLAHLRGFFRPKAFQGPAAVLFFRGRSKGKGSQQGSSPHPGTRILGCHLANHRQGELRVQQPEAAGGLCAHPRVPVFPCLLGQHDPIQVFKGRVSQGLLHQKTTPASHGFLGCAAQLPDQFAQVFCAAFLGGLHARQAGKQGTPQHHIRKFGAAQEFNDGLHLTPERLSRGHFEATGTHSRGGIRQEPFQEFRPLPALQSDQRPRGYGPQMGIFFLEQAAQPAGDFGFLQIGTKDREGFHGGHHRVPTKLAAQGFQTLFCIQLAKGLGRC